MRYLVVFGVLCVGVMSVVSFVAHAQTPPAVEIIINNENTQLSQNPGSLIKEPGSSPDLIFSPVSGFGALFSSSTIAPHSSVAGITHISASDSLVFAVDMATSKQSFSKHYVCTMLVEQNPFNQQPELQFINDETKSTEQAPACTSGDTPDAGSDQGQYFHVTESIKNNVKTYTIDFCDAGHTGVCQ